MKIYITVMSLDITYLYDYDNKYLNFDFQVLRGPMSSLIIQQ